MHRDISEGNVLIAENALYKGFIGDFDCGFNWKLWLEEKKLTPSLDIWERYVQAVYCLENEDELQSGWYKTQPYVVTEEASQWDLGNPPKGRVVSTKSLFYPAPPHVLTTGYLAIHGDRNFGRKCNPRCST